MGNHNTSVHPRDSEDASPGNGNLIIDLDSSSWVIVSFGTRPAELDANQSQEVQGSTEEPNTDKDSEDEQPQSDELEEKSHSTTKVEEDQLDKETDKPDETDPQELNGNGTSGEGTFGDDDRPQGDEPKEETIEHDPRNDLEQSSVKEETNDATEKVTTQLGEADDLKLLEHVNEEMTQPGSETISESTPAATDNGGESESAESPKEDSEDTISVDTKRQQQPATWQQQSTESPEPILAMNRVTNETHNENGNTALHLVIIEKDLNALRQLLEENPENINVANKDGRTPLHVACEVLVQDDDASSGQGMSQQQRAEVEHLLQKGANCTLQDKDGNTPLHLAALRSDLDTVKLLIKHCPYCINIINKVGNTALHIGCREGADQIVQELCNRKADASIPNIKQGQTAMHLACEYKRNDCAKILATYDRSVLDCIDKNKQTPLHITCKHGNATLTKELIMLTNCDPYKEDNELKTPLHYACSWDDPELVAPLLKYRKHGKELFVNARDKDRNTALDIASRCGHQQIVDLLVKNKAKQNKKNSEKKMAAEGASGDDRRKGKASKKKLKWPKKKSKKEKKPEFETTFPPPRPGYQHFTDEEDDMFSESLI